MSEPVLLTDDLAVWDAWMRTCRVHGQTQVHRRRVDQARRVVERELGRSRTPQLGWSGGKDSTALTHLVVVGCGARHVRVVSEKDDLDFPGEEAYVGRLAGQWGADLAILRPPSSPLAFVRAQFAAGRLLPGDEIHARAAELSKRFFYAVVEEADRGRDLIMLGLRAEESYHRRRLRESRGLAYTIKSGQRRVQPLADWRGVDVYAYLDRVGVDVLPLYRCVGLMHRAEPWRLRKAWWLPGAAAAKGQVVWLRRYWPSLYRQLVVLAEGVRRFG